jgi:hypothetical protein
MFYALIIFIGAHVYTLDHQLTWTACQRAISVSVDDDIMQCVRDQEI